MIVTEIAPIWLYEFNSIDPSKLDFSLQCDPFLPYIGMGSQTYTVNMALNKENYRSRRINKFLSSTESILDRNPVDQLFRWIVSKCVHCSFVRFRLSIIITLNSIIWIFYHFVYSHFIVFQEQSVDWLNFSFLRSNFSQYL